MWGAGCPSCTPAVVEKVYFIPWLTVAAMADWPVVGAGVIRGPALATSFIVTANLNRWGIQLLNYARVDEVFQRALTPSAVGGFFSHSTGKPPFQTSGVCCSMANC